MGNDIGDEGAKVIAEALKTNTTLTKINLNCDNDSHFMIYVLLC